jgi:hypothetical protein
MPMNMISNGLYIFYEGYLREIVSELEDAFIIDNGDEYLVVSKNDYPIYSLKDFSPFE